MNYTNAKEQMFDRGLVMEVYESYPKYNGLRYSLRIVERSDCDDLLKVYSDVKSVRLFNSDNCYGDDFYYTTKEEIMNAIDFWLDKYGRKEFVRWSVVDNTKKEVIGTIEMFHRDADDAFTNCGLLRLDLRSDYEFSTEITKILRPLLNVAFSWFDCDMIATKAISEAVERISALKRFGFEKSDEKLIGHDGTEYSDYYVRRKTISAWENPPLLSKEDEELFDNFLYKELRFHPSSYESDPILPFSLNRPFTVYDISGMTDEQIGLLYELVPTAIANCLQNGHKIFSHDWNHNLFLYDPRNPENCSGWHKWGIRFNEEGIAHFADFYPDGDYYFHIEKYGRFGYLSHPWREEVWIFGEKLLREFDEIYEQIGFVPKAVLK